MNKEGNRREKGRNKSVDMQSLSTYHHHKSSISNNFDSLNDLFYHAGVNTIAEIIQIVKRASKDRKVINSFLYLYSSSLNYFDL